VWKAVIRRVDADPLSPHPNGALPPQPLGKGQASCRIRVSDPCPVSSRLRAAHLRVPNLDAGLDHDGAGAVERIVGVALLT
jgi:hypothetical protein